ncbi:MAG TPA: SpoIIE family protein phosphatase [Segeticoccus sp.]|nr:SpoIIE family protein phosphatase [Segeticoccus sp.]
MLLPEAVGWAAGLQHLDALEEAAFAVDPGGQVRYANEVAVRLYPVLGDRAALGFPVRDLVPAQLHGALDEVIGQAAAGTTWRGRLAVLGSDGVARETDMVCAPVQEHGEVVGVVCVVHDATDPGATAKRAHRLDDRLARLARAAAELGAAADVETVTDVVISHLCDAVGATVASLSLLQGDVLTLAGLRGGAPGADQRWTTFPVSTHTPASEVVRTGEPLFLIGRDAIDAAYPELEKAAEGERSMVALPVRLVGQTIGVVTLSFPGERSLDAAELEFFGIVADSCAQALERIRAQGEAAKQAARARFLAEASAELANSLDYETTLTSVAKMAIPEFADWSGVDLLQDGRIHRLAVEHFDPAKVQFALDIERRYPSDRDTNEGAWAVLASGQSVLIPEITDEMLVEGAKDAEHLRLARMLELRSLLMVPLVARDQVLGVISWVMAESHRSYTEEDVKFAEELARRAAIAIDNSQLHSQTKEVAEQLQRAVLPTLPQSIPGWQLASCYEPAGRTEVGGDFYDAIPLEDGRLALFVGDVMGRGVEAAAAMAQMRSALRAHIAVDPAPERVINQMRALFTTYDIPQLVTLVYLVASSDSLVYVNAGHPPPVMLTAAGTGRALPLADRPPLGVPSPPKGSRIVPFAPGDTLLAYTDGLIERREEDIDNGLARLLSHLPALDEGPLPGALAGLVECVRDHGRDDDVAAVALRHG